MKETILAQIITTKAKVQALPADEKERALALVQAMAALIDGEQSVRVRALAICMVNLTATAQLQADHEQQAAPAGRKVVVHG